MSTIQENFNEQEIAELLEHTPDKKIETLKYALEGDGLAQNHLAAFQKKLKSGYFTSFKEKEDEILNTLSEYRLREIYQNLLKTILAQKSTTIKAERFAVEEVASSVESLNDLDSIEDMSENSQATETEEELDDLID